MVHGDFVDTGTGLPALCSHGDRYGPLQYTSVIHALPMLTASDVRRKRQRRPPPSLSQLYQEYVLQRIESYKNSLTRDELLRLGDEAIAELQQASEDQFVLTEVLMLESVDRLIAKRLRIKTFNRWRKQHVTLRAAQQQPTHWQIDHEHPVAHLLPRLEPGDHVAVIGSGFERFPCLLAAHDVAVTYLATDMGSVERLETRMAAESLASEFQAFVTQLVWVPPTKPVNLVMLDTEATVDLTGPALRDLIFELQGRTLPGGLHYLEATGTGPPPAAFREWYARQSNWPSETDFRHDRLKCQAWLRPASQNDTEAAQRRVSS